jgi:hypothetical protein
MLGMRKYGLLSKLLGGVTDIRWIVAALLEH